VGTATWKFAVVNHHYHDRHINIIFFDQSLKLLKFVCVIYFMYLSVPFLISLNQKINDISNLFFIEFFELYCTELLGLASTVI